MAATAQPEPKDWSELPEELIVMISERLSVYADYARFRSVCVSWNSALARTPLNHHPSRQPQYLPFLLLPCEDIFLLDWDEEDEMCSRSLLSLSENGKIYHLRGLPSLEFRSVHCPGSSHGWLVIVDEDTPSVKLINPFTRAQLPLPPMDTFRDVEDYYEPYNKVGEEHRIRRYQTPGFIPRLTVQKVVLSSSPSSQIQSESATNVVAVAIFGGPDGYLITACSRPGDKAWTCFPKDRFMDVLFYKDHLYAVISNFKILVIHMDMDMDNGGGGGGCLVPKLVDTLQPPEGFCSHWSPYLVESCGDLLLVAREVEERESGVFFAPPRKYSEDRTIGFRIFKLCQENSSDLGNKSASSSSSSKWVQMKNIGDRMLFLGVNSSFSLSSHDFPGCRWNSIYFTHHHSCQDRYYVRQGSDYDIDAFDMGVFNLKDERFEPLPLEGCPCRGRDPLLRLCPSPIWLLPTSN